MDYFEVVVILALGLFCLPNYLLLYFKLTHADGKDDCWNDTFLVEDLTLLLVEGQTI